jgi:hypothetical protein
MYRTALFRALEPRGRNSVKFECAVGLRNRMSEPAICCMFRIICAFPPATAPRLLPLALAVAYTWLIHRSEQILTTRYSRRLITMEKVRQYDTDAAAAFYAAHPEPIMAIDRLHDIVYEQLPAASTDTASAANEDGGAAKPRRRCRGKQF